MRRYGHLTDSGDINSNQMISARISEQSSIFATNDEPISRPTCPQSAATRVPKTEYTYPTLLIFISGALVGGNYDSYSNQDYEDAQTSDSDMFLGIDTRSGTSAQHSIVTISGITSKVAKAEGKKLNEKQYIAYEIIICSFLLRLVLSGNHTHSTTFQIMYPVEKEVLIIQLKARGGQEQLVMFLI